MNHLEQLVSEWLQYRGYFVRSSVAVGPLPHGGFEGELDVVALHPGKRHLLHVECSLDALRKADRHERYSRKFERGRRFAPDVFTGLELPETLEQVVVLQLASGRDREFGGGRVVTVRELIREIVAGLARTSPASKAVSVNLPLLRTIQLTADAVSTSKLVASEHRLLMPTAGLEETEREAAARR